eukprot:225135-Prymnesium_polylepis.1
MKTPSASICASGATRTESQLPGKQDVSRLPSTQSVDGHSGCSSLAWTPTMATVDRCLGQCFRHGRGRCQGSGRSDGGVGAFKGSGRLALSGSWPDGGSSNRGAHDGGDGDVIDGSMSDGDGIGGGGCDDDNRPSAARGDDDANSPSTAGGGRVSKRLVGGGPGALAVWDNAVDTSCTAGSLAAARVGASRLVEERNHDEELPWRCWRGKRATMVKRSPVLNVARPSRQSPRRQQQARQNSSPRPLP